MTKLYKFIQDKAVRESKSSVEWSGTDNASYRAGASNACLSILDFIERHPDCNEEVNENKS